MQLEPGIYVNLFQVSLKTNKFTVMTTSRSNVPRFWEINSKYEENDIDITLYPDGNLIYAYGSDISLLTEFDFELKEIGDVDSPRLTCRMILDGIINEAEKHNYKQLGKEYKGRTTLLNEDIFKQTSDRNVRIYTGIDIRVIFLKEPIEKMLVYGLIADTRYILRDSNNNPLNFQQIVEKFGNNILKEVRYYQKDLIPTNKGAKINPEVSRQRLLEDIIPFINLINKISLPCGVEALINPMPVRIILGDDDVSLW